MIIGFLVGNSSYLKWSDKWLQLIDLFVVQVAAVEEKVASAAEEVVAQSTATVEEVSASAAQAVEEVTAAAAEAADKVQQVHLDKSS